MGSIDVSIGLIPTLQLLAQYHQSGILQAKIPHLPGLRGTGIGVVEIIGGKIVSCCIQNEKGERRFLVVDRLTRFDKRKGPFEWRFYAQQPQSNVTILPHVKNQPYASKPRPLAGRDIPQVIANLSADLQVALSPDQKRALRMTYAMIDGRRTLEDIEVHAPLPKGAVYNAVVALITLKIIVIKFQ